MELTDISISATVFQRSIWDLNPRPSSLYQNKRWCPVILRRLALGQGLDLQTNISRQIEKLMPDGV